MQISFVSWEMILTLNSALFFDKKAEAVKAGRPKWEINVSRRQNGFTASVCIQKRNNAALYLYWFPYKDLGFPPRNPPWTMGQKPPLYKDSLRPLDWFYEKPPDWLRERCLHSVFRECYWVTTWSSQLIQDCMILVTKGQTLMTQWEKKKRKKKECWQQAYESVFEGAACEDGCRLKAETHMGGYVEQGPVQRTNGRPIEEDAQIVIDSCLMLS